MLHKQEQLLILLREKLKKSEQFDRNYMMGQKNTFLLAMVLIALIAIESQAEKHVVGGTQGWETSTDLASWASSKTFKVGDQLVFKYSSGLHSVTELPNESAYKNCDVTAALDSKSSGNDVVKLSKAGTRYFTCGTFGHCDQGMKFKIKIVTGSANSSPASPSTTTDTTATTTTATSSASSATTTFVFVTFFSLLATLVF